MLGMGVKGGKRAIRGGGGERSGEGRVVPAKGFFCFVTSFGC